MITRPRHVQDWSRLFDDIYGHVNQGKTWLHFASMLPTHLCLAISPKYYNGPGDFEWQFGKSIAWLIGLHNSQARPSSADSDFGSLRDLANLLLSEFPRRCPYCDCSPCSYDSSRHGSSARRNGRNRTFNAYHALIKAEPEANVFTLQGWADTVIGIYKQDAELPIGDLAGKVAEEFGELVNALNLYRKLQTNERRADYCEEFADLFSRFCVFGRRVLEFKEKHDHGSSQRTIDDLVWRVYEHGCPSPKCFSRRRPGSIRCECEAGPPEEQKGILFDGLYGPKDVEERRTFEIVVKAEANANADASAAASAASFAAFDLHCLASQDRSEHPELVRLVQEIVSAIRESHLDANAVRSKAQQLIQAAPTSRRRGYYDALIALLKATVVAAASKSIASELTDVMESLTNFFSTL